MVRGEETVSRLTGLEVFLPDGRRLGVVHDAVVDANGLQCTHLFVRDPDEALVEGSVHIAIPWRWIRAVDQIVLLRWFPPTPIPMNSGGRDLVGTPHSWDRFCSARRCS